MMRRGLATLWLAVVAVLAACSQPSEGDAFQATPDPTEPASRTPVPASPTVTSTPLPSATPTPTLPPLSIDLLRGQTYPGSEVNIEEQLVSGANYYRYLASYRSEGWKIYALLTVPFGEPPESGWPVVVFNHGYIPPEQYRTTERYVNYVDGFARQGYIVFRSDYRGHGDSEGEARGGYGSPDYTIDVLNAVAAMRNYPTADPNRIGMWGHSMGGYITLRAMVTDPEIRAGVIWAGVVASYPDLFERWRRGPTSPGPTRTPRPGSWRTTLLELYGTPEENPDFWAPLSANSYLHELSGPLQLHHGTADNSVPVEFSAILYQQVLSAGGSIEFYEYEGDNHNLSNYFTTAMVRSVLFFDRYLKGDG